MPSERLGKYELLRHLASGGMASIYLARVSGLGGFERHCVIKTLHAEHLGDDSYVGMFLDEAKVVAALHHPHIAQVFEVGRSDDGRYFLAMEYLHGETVRSVIDTAHDQRTKLRLEVGLTITIAACSGLHYAHERRGPDGQPLGIVHRDVSPSNVIANYDGSIKLIDFGIAKSSTRNTHTRTGFIKGKAGYMSPEQARGYPTDRRSDVFSLGVLAYELTTQTRPFGDDNQFETVRRTVHGEVEAPSKICPGYPAALEHVVMTALQTDPDERFQSADEMRRALESIAEHLGLALGPGPVMRTLEGLFGRRLEPWLASELEAPPAPRRARGSMAPPPIPRAASPARSALARGSGNHATVDPTALPFGSAAGRSGAATVDPIPNDEDQATRKFEREVPDEVPDTVVDEPTTRETVDLSPVARALPRKTTLLPAGEIERPPPRVPVTQRTASRRRRNALIGGVALGCATIVGMVAMAIASSRTDSQASASSRPTQGTRPAPVAQITPLEAPPPAPTPAPAPAPAPTIELRVKTDPPGATVVLDGERLGSAPYTATLPASDKLAWLKVRMPHHLPVKIQVSLAHDVTWSVKLPVLETPPAPQDEPPTIPVDQAPPASDR